MLELYCDYDIFSDIFWFETNMKQENLKDFLLEFLRGEMGKGKDSRKPTDDLYSIDLRLDMTDDTFYVKDNCNNNGLRDGILLLLVERIK